MVPNRWTDTFELITPCFCAGADQGKAEIRAPSIRGELRWWFRAVGGTAQQELAVFGGVQPKARASSLRVRVESLEKSSKAAAVLPRMELTEPLYYLYYYAHVSGSKGERTSGGGFLPVGSGFRVLWHTEQARFDSEARRILDTSLEAFRVLGSVGLRQRRGCGAWICEGDLFNREDFLSRVRLLPSTVQVLALGEKLFDSGLDAQRELAKFLKAFRKKEGLSAEDKTALGTGGDGRLASALRLRPVQLGDGRYMPTLIYLNCFLPARVEDITSCLIDAVMKWPEYGAGLNESRRQPRPRR